MANFRVPRDANALLDWAGQMVRDLNRQVKYTTFGAVTLDLASTQTVVSDPSVRAGSVIQLQAVTSEAATASATTFIPTTQVENGRFVISHASNSTAGRTFTYSVFEPNVRTR